MSEEVRTTSETGGEKGVKPERWALLPIKGLNFVARVFGFGASKYAAHNWRRGYEWDKSIDALYRHVGAFVDGETYDPESKLPHLAHAGFHILVLLTWLAEQGEGPTNPYDTRWKTDLQRAELAKGGSVTRFTAGVGGPGPLVGKVLPTNFADELLAAQQRQVMQRERL